MKPTVKLGKVAGIPVGASWTVVVLLAIVADILGTALLPATVRHQPPLLYWSIAVATALLFWARCSSTSWPMRSSPSAPG